MAMRIVAEIRNILKWWGAGWILFFIGIFMVFTGCMVALMIYGQCLYDAVYNAIPGGS